MPPRNFIDEEETMIAAIYSDGASARKIARIYGLSSHTSICSALRRRGIKQRSQSERNRLYQINHNVFDVITPKSAYWWGFIYADGYIGREKSLTVALKMGDKQQIINLKDFLQTEAPIKDYIAINNGNEYPVTRLSVTHRHLASRLIELGVVTGRNRFDAIPKYLPKQNIRHWIRGYFDGDGSIDYRRSGQPRFRLVGQKDLLEWIREQLNSITEISPLTLHKSGMYYLGIYGRKKVALVSKYLYRDTSLFMERKHEIMVRTYIIPPPKKRNKRGRYI